MPDLNINVNARTERAKKDLRSLDKEILRLSDSEKILSKSLARSGNVGAKAFKKISGAAVKQAKAVNSAARQFRQLRSQLIAAGAAPQVISRLTNEFSVFRRVMEGGTVASRKFQRTQDKFSTTLRTTARQFKLLSGEIRNSTNATAKLNAQNKANQAALARQAHALSNTKIQYKQLLAQMHRLGASRNIIRSTTRAFSVFTKEMNKSALSSIQLQRSQDKLKTSFAGTRRRLVRVAAATNRANAAAKKGGRSFTGLGHTLENLGSTAVLVAGPLSGIGSRLIAFGAIAKRGSLAAAGIFSAIAGAGVLIFKSIGAFDELNLSLAKTEAILKATGKAANITSGFVDKLAVKLARETLADVEDTRPGAATLLTFKGIGAENLERVLTLSQDVSSLGLTDFTNALKLLGRASEDPIKNLDSLRRVGIQLTLAQKDQITTLQNMGRGMEGFNIILDTIEKKVGGAGKAQNTGLSGSLDQLGLAWTQLLESLGKGTLYNLAVEAIDSIASRLEHMAGLVKAFKGILEFGVKSPKVVSMDIPPKEGESTTTNTTAKPPSHVEKAFIDANIGVKRSIMDLDAEAEKLRFGFTLMSPEVLKLAEKHKVLDDIVKVLEGDFSGLTDHGRKVAEMAIKTSDALQELERRKEGFNIFKSARSPLEKYNDELKRLIFLYNRGHINANTLAAKQKELNETLENATPKFEKDLINANAKIKRSIIELNAEAEKLGRGFSLISPEILKLAEKNKSLDGIVKVLAGDFSGLTTEGRKIAEMVKETNDALLDFERRKEALTISKDTRSGLEKYNDELKRLIFLYDNSYISAGSLAKRNKELLEVLDAAMPKFEKALTNANSKVKASLIELSSKEEKLRNGFTLMSPEVLKLAEKYESLDDITKVLAGDFDGLTDAELKVANMAIKTSDALQNLEIKLKAFNIIKETRSALEKYSDALRELTFLYNIGAINASNFAVRHKELRASLESMTPELNIITSASEKFGDSLADLVVKGEDFSSGLKSIFKSLVDDIIKQFFKLSVINPILNGIFGASADRPGIGSQGGGTSGLGGSGGLLGMIMGGSPANDNAPRKGLSKGAWEFDEFEEFKEEGDIQAKNYGESLAETNKKMGSAGGKAASDFGGLFADMAGGVASAVGGGIGSFLGNAFADLLGFQHGGSFKVGGSGGKDSQLVAFKASPRERVSVETPGQQSRQGSGNTTYIDARGVDPGQMSRLVQVIKDLDESVEVRAVNATVDARDRNTSLFGRT